MNNDLNYTVLQVIDFNDLTRHNIIKKLDDARLA